MATATRAAAQSKKRELQELTDANVALDEACVLVAQLEAMTGDGAPLAAKLVNDIIDKVTGIEDIMAPNGLNAEEAVAKQQLLKTMATEALHNVYARRPWSCLNCKTFNSHAVSKCTNCGAAKPGLMGGGFAEWVLELTNYLHMAYCSEIIPRRHEDKDEDDAAAGAAVASASASEQQSEQQGWTICTKNGYFVCPSLKLISRNHTQLCLLLG